MTYSLFLLPFESFEYYADNIQTALDSLTKTKNIPDTDSKTNEKIKTKYDPKTTHGFKPINSVPELDLTAEERTSYPVTFRTFSTPVICLTSSATLSTVSCVRFKEVPSGKLTLAMKYP